ncbi:hypothetical protein OG758_47515 [Streptomyces sp. NBC_01474]|uniref:hypothetical protein n=1 Tax=Streptomyces sp. NBC_01474 TaxID=2903880 RepID=UPI002DDAB72B|nr:hypothetical protein [Streptomyces sp. NBC_01474]WSE01100.1 hypothetical protein OG758_47515 [Streptomyces sp. NBC_01474]
MVRLLVSFAEVAMPSVPGLLETRERNVREEVAWLREEAERVQAALGATQAELSRLADARATVAEVLSRDGSAGAGPAPGAVAGSMVPERIEGMGAQVLAAEYQQILSVLADPAPAQKRRRFEITAPPPPTALG